MDRLDATGGLLAVSALAVVVFSLVDAPTAGFGIVAVGGIGGVLSTYSEWRHRQDLREAAATVFRMTVVGLSGLLAIVVWQSLLGSVAISVVEGGSLTETQRTLVGTIALGLGTGTTALLYVRATDRDLSFVDFQMVSLRDIGYVLGGILALFAGLLGIQFLMAQAGVSSAEHGIVETAKGNPEILLVLIPASWLVVGPGEELLFRNVVQKSMYDVLPRSGAVVAASLVFAAVHLPAYAAGADSQAQVVASLGVVFVLALVLGTIYARTDNLTVPALVHGTFNAVQFALLYINITGWEFTATLAF